MPKNAESAALSSPWTAYLCLAASMSLVGAYVALSKPLVAVLPVFLLAWLRFGIAAVAMLRWLRKPKDEPALTLSMRGLVFLESFLGNFLFSICMLFGVSMTSAVSAGVIMASIPAVVAIMSWLVLKERIGGRIWVAAVLGALGMGILSLSKSELPMQGIQGPEPDLMHKQWVGNALVFAAVLCEAAYAVIGKKLTGTLDPKRISALINLWGLLLVTPLGAYAAWSFDFSAVNVGSWGLLVFYALAASMWTVWLWMTGLKGVPAARAGIFAVMLPISTALVGVVVLGEPMRTTELLAFAIALLGIVLATFPTKEAPTKA
jgi:drug/metabolite transporter (DMT)-like permease